MDVKDKTSFTRMIEELVRKYAGAIAEVQKLYVLDTKLVYDCVLFEMWAMNASYERGGSERVHELRTRMRDVAMQKKGRWLEQVTDPLCREIVEFCIGDFARGAMQCVLTYFVEKYADENRSNVNARYIEEHPDKDGRSINYSIQQFLKTPGVDEDFSLDFICAQGRQIIKMLQGGAL